MHYGDLHPITVHFPVVLITVAITLDVASQLTRNKRIYSIASWFVIATIVSLIPTIWTGFEASYRFKGENTYVNLHMALGIMAFCGMVLNGILRLFYLYEYPILTQFYSIILNALAFFLLIITGDLGGVITHGRILFAERSEKPMDYYGLNPALARSAKPDKLEGILGKQIDVHDAMEIFRRQKCVTCHQQYFTDDRPNFSVNKGDLKAWLPRDSNLQLVDWEKSPFYTIVIQKNRMPYDEHNSPIGLSWGDRLVLLEWLKNGAPETEPATDTQDEADSNSG